MAVQGEAGQRATVTPPRRYAAPPWGLPAPDCLPWLRERRWATKGVLSVAHPSAFFSVRGGSPAPAARATGSYLPAGLAAAATEERDRDQDHQSFHLFVTSFRRFRVLSHRHTAFAFRCYQPALPPPPPRKLIAIRMRANSMVHLTGWKSVACFVLLVLTSALTGTG